MVRVEEGGEDGSKAGTPSRFFSSTARASSFLSFVRFGSTTTATNEAPTVLVVKFEPGTGASQSGHVTKGAHPLTPLLLLVIYLLSSLFELADYKGESYRNL